jgi:hypothetical protein
MFYNLCTKRKEEKKRINVFFIQKIESKREGRKGEEI